MNKEELFASVDFTSLEREAEQRQQEQQSAIQIDDITRKIIIPEHERLMGVETDQNTERKRFVCKRIVDDNVDLTKYVLRVNWENANRERDQYIVDDVKVEGENITFSWLLNKRAVRYKGIIKFIVCATKTDEKGEVINKWNTTLGMGEVLEGLPVTRPIIIEQLEKDTIAQLLQIVKQTSADAVKDVTDEGTKQKAEIADMTKNLATREYVNDTFASAFVQKDFGNVITSDMVSPVEHNVVCRLESENLLTELRETSAFVIWYETTGFIAEAGATYTWNLKNKASSLEIRVHGKIPFETLIIKYNADKITFSFDVDTKVYFVAYYVNELLTGKTNEHTLSRGTTPLPYIPFVSDLSKTKLWVSGKNFYSNSLFKIKRGSIRDSNSIISNVVNGYFISAVLDTKYVELFNSIIKPRRTLTLSCSTTNNITLSVLLYVSDSNGKVRAIEKTAHNNVVNFEVPDFERLTNVEFRFNVKPESFTDTTTVLSKIQLELSKKTGFEPFRGTISYPTLPDGTVENVKSISPSMTMFSDTNGVIVNAQHNLDGKKYVDKRIAELEQAIISR